MPARKVKAKPKTIKAKVHSKTELVEHIRKMATELETAKRIIEEMQTEIKQLTSMHRTQLQIIDNLSTKIRDDS